MQQHAMSRGGGVGRPPFRGAPFPRRPFIRVRVICGMQYALVCAYLVVVQDSSLQFGRNMSFNAFLLQGPVVGRFMRGGGRFMRGGRGRGGVMEGSVITIGSDVGSVRFVPPPRGMMRGRRRRAPRY